MRFMSNEDSDERRQVNVAQLVRQMRENLVAHLELEVLLAKVTRRKYQALVAEGFTEQQALELCKR